MFWFCLLSLPKIWVLLWWLSVRLFGKPSHWICFQSPWNKHTSQMTSSSLSLSISLSLSLSLSLSRPSFFFSSVLFSHLVSPRSLFFIFVRFSSAVFFLLPSVSLLMTSTSAVVFLARFATLTTASSKLPQWQTVNLTTAYNGKQSTVWLLTMANSQPYDCLQWQTVNRMTAYDGNDGPHGPRTEPRFSFFVLTFHLDVVLPYFLRFHWDTRAHTHKKRNILIHSSRYAFYSRGVHNWIRFGFGFFFVPSLSLSLSLCLF